MNAHDDLAMQVDAVRGDLAALVRRVAVLAAQYDDLDIAPDTAEAAAVVEVIDSLSDAGLSLNDTLGHIDTASWNAQRLPFP